MLIHTEIIIWSLKLPRLNKGERKESVLLEFKDLGKRKKYQKKISYTYY